ncbi:hypothetical protein D3C80_1781430 [compost metagenome]
MTRLHTRYVANIASTSSGLPCRDTNNPVPKLNRIPASIAAAIAAGSLPMIRSKAPDTPTRKMIRLLTR